MTRNELRGLCAISASSKSYPDWLRRAVPFSVSMTFGIFHQRYPVPWQLGRGHAGVGYRARSTAARKRGTTSQMYRNDLCTWLDVLSPHHAWPPIATSLPVTWNSVHSWEKTIPGIRLSKSPFWMRAKVPWCRCVSLIFYRIILEARDSAFALGYVQIFINNNNKNFFREI